MPTRAEAHALWDELNERQRYYLECFYRADQQVEADRRSAAAAGNWDRRPASEWRLIDSHHEPHLPELVGLTSPQRRWEEAGYHSQGNGSTLAALGRRGLITRSGRRTPFGTMHQVAMTALGRAVVRAGTGAVSVAARTRQGLLGERAWEVLVELWKADQREQALTWNYSATIERVLIDRHDPPLAEHATPGYRIAEAGRAFYRARYAEHLAQYPHLNAPDPAGAPALWPAEADRMLSGYAATLRSLGHARERIRKSRDQAEHEWKSAAQPSAWAPKGDPWQQQWNRLLAEQAQARCDLAVQQLGEVERELPQARARYLAAVHAAVEAAVAGAADPVATITAAASAPEPAKEIPAPPRTGVREVDVRAERLHLLASRPPAHVTARQQHLPWADEPWLTYGEHLREAVADGTLYRRAHPVPLPERPKKPRRPRGMVPESAWRILARLHELQQTGTCYLHREIDRLYPEGRPAQYADLPIGLMPAEVGSLTRSRTALEKLRGHPDGPLVQVTTVPVPKDTRPDATLDVVHLTDVGRAHIAARADDYTTRYPQVQQRSS